MSSLINCPRQEEDGLPGVAAYLMQSRTPQGERGGTLAKIQLAKTREANQRSLATTMALEEEIEQDLGLPGCPCPLLELGPEEEEVLGAE